MPGKRPLSCCNGTNTTTPDYFDGMDASKRRKLTVSVLQNGVPVKWRAIANDGADPPVHLQLIIPAKDQSVSVGQTMDFEFNPGKGGNYLFAVKDYKGSTVLNRLLLVK